MRRNLQCGQLANVVFIEWGVGSSQWDRWEVCGGSLILRCEVSQIWGS